MEHVRPAVFLVCLCSLLWLGSARQCCNEPSPDTTPEHSLAKVPTIYRVRAQRSMLSISVIPKPATGVSRSRSSSSSSGGGSGDEGAQVADDPQVQAVTNYRIALIRGGQTLRAGLGTSLPGNNLPLAMPLQVRRLKSQPSVERTVKAPRYYIYPEAASVSEPRAFTTFFRLPEVPAIVNITAAVGDILDVFVRAPPKPGAAAYLGYRIVGVPTKRIANATRSMRD